MSQCPQIDDKYTPLMANQWAKQYGWMVHTMDNFMVSLWGSRWGYQSGPDKVSIFLGCAAKTIAANYVVMAMGK
jgi:hypothetical protein